MTPFEKWTIIMTFVGLVVAAGVGILNAPQDRLDMLFGWIRKLSFRRQPPGERLAARWTKFQQSQQLIFCQGLITKSGDINPMFGGNELSRALIEIISCRSTLDAALPNILLIFYVTSGVCASMSSVAFGHVSTPVSRSIVVARLITIAAGGIALYLLQLDWRILSRRNLAREVEAKVIRALEKHIAQDKSAQTTAPGGIRVT
jgi:hypothetical protein